MVSRTGNFLSKAFNRIKIISMFHTTMLVILLMSFAVVQVNSFVTGSRPLSKRSFFDVQCKGVFDKGIFSKLDRICDDCFNLYREPQLHSLCRKSCFSTDTFLQCLVALELEEEVEMYQGLVSKVNAPSPKANTNQEDNNWNSMGALMENLVDMM